MYTTTPFRLYLQFTGMLALMLYLQTASAQDSRQIYGYTVEGDSIHFKFVRQQYDYVIQKGDDRKFSMEQLTIYDVTLLIGFRKERPSTYLMQANADSSVYTVSFPLDTLPPADWTFRFYINSYYAVEPPPEAINRIPSDGYQRYYFVTLLAQDTPQLLEPGKILTDTNAGQWLSRHATQVNSSKGLKMIQEVLANRKVVGIGQPEQHLQETLPLRLGLAQWLISAADYHLLAFQIDPMTTLQIENYLSGDSAALTDRTLEIINIIRWSDLNKSRTQPARPLYMGYQKEDVTQSMQLLQQLAPPQDTLLQQEMLQLAHEINSLLLLQEEWGVYYYDSPSFQQYLSELWHSIYDKLRASERYEYEPYRQLKPAMLTIRNYLRHLDNLKNYYRDIEKQLSKYFYWMGKPNLDVRFVVWDENHEISHTRPGSVGKYLHEQYGEEYVSVAIGSYDFKSSEQPGAAFSLELPFLQETEKRKVGQQAFMIDLREKTLTPEEERWLRQKIYSPAGQKMYKGKLQQDFDLVILIDEPD